MTKNDLINDIVTMLLPTFTNEQLEIIKSTFIVKMQGFDDQPTHNRDFSRVRLHDMKEVEQTALAMVGQER